jgi:serine/threonine protein kinase
MLQVIGSPHKRWAGLEKLPHYCKLVLHENLPNRLREKLGVQPEGALPMALDHVLTEAGGDLIAQMLQWDPRDRISVVDALKHPWFDEVPRAVEGCFMPQIHKTLHHANFPYD